MPRSRTRAARAMIIIMKTLLLIDASALVYRFFHALPPLTAPSGDQIQAIYGLSSVLLKILKEQKPDYAAAALDRPEKTFREEKFEEYKSHRPPAPNALVFQLRLLPEVFQNFNIKTFDKAGFEADDIIGTLSSRFSEEKDLRIIILSGDLDVLQLVRDNSIVGQIIKTGVSNTEIYDEKKVEERYGLKPSRLADYKGLVGDTSDNIPGVKGIGPKSARELIKEFGNLENIYENLGLVKDSLAKKFESTKEKALLYRELATIDKNAPIQMPALQELAVKPPTPQILESYFEKLGFKSLARRLEN